MDTLNCDPDATENGVDHKPRQVFTGHYVPVDPTPIKEPEYVAHSKRLFCELGFADSMAQSFDFIRLFSGDMSVVQAPMRKMGWATGYALSIYGAEYVQQCPFQTGNGYGDGRAISVLEVVVCNKRWEMQLKGGGQTPYCRGGDGRAVLRSSVREFLAQEHMHALGVPTSRSLCLYASKSETVRRPWYSPGSLSQDPDRYINERVAISTRVAPSFLRVGQVELFARRARVNQHPAAMEELKKIVLHVMEREYANEIDAQLTLPEKVILLARRYQYRLASMVANWIRVGFCQGNFNSDNCALGGFTLDYGPFGFCDVFSPSYQSWTGGGQHFAFMNQPHAAQKNFDMFCSALRPLLESCEEVHGDHLLTLNDIQKNFSMVMQAQMKQMWANKLGLSALCTTDDSTAFNNRKFNNRELNNRELNSSEVNDAEFNAVLSELTTLMTNTPVDYTIFFRELSFIPNDITPLKKSFYDHTSHADAESMDQRWAQWLSTWKTLLLSTHKKNTDAACITEDISRQMKQVNPKYILREWCVVPAYERAALGDYTLVHELQAVMTQPYAEQSKDIEDKYYRLKPAEFFHVGGVSHLSCSS